MPLILLIVLSKTSGAKTCVGNRRGKHVQNCLTGMIGALVFYFGDGAGAVILEASEEVGILSTHIHADGDHDALLQVPPGEKYLMMEGNDVFQNGGLKRWVELLTKTLAANNLEKK